MSPSGWFLIIIGALINFLAKPVLKKRAGGEEVSVKVLYTVKIVGLWLVIIGAAMIFIAGGRVDVGAIR